jgi:hypothetical protein
MRFPEPPAGGEAAMLTADELQRTTLETVTSYRYEAPAHSFGVVKSEAWVQEQLDQLRNCLVRPSLQEFVNHDALEIVDGGPPSTTRFWLVAEEASGCVVFFDEAAREYGLGRRDPAGRLETTNVRGDLVGVFLAR